MSVSPTTLLLFQNFLLLLKNQKSSGKFSVNSIYYGESYYQNDLVYYCKMRKKNTTAFLLNVQWFLKNVVIRKNKWTLNYTYILTTAGIRRAWIIWNTDFCVYWKIKLFVWISFLNDKYYIGTWST